MKILLPTLVIATLTLSESNLGFRAVEGTTIERHIGQKTTWTLESMAQVGPAGRVDEEIPEATGGVELELAVTDEYEKVADGRVLRMKRAFDEAQSTVSMDLDAGEQAQVSFRLDCKSPLRTREVRFQRKTADDALVASPAAEDSVLDELVEGLTEDLDLRALLPEKPPAEGKSWEVPAQALASVLAPGGALGLEPDAAVVKKVPTEVMTPYQTILSTLIGPCDNTGKIEGDVECTWKETSKKDGRELARIEFEMDVTTKTDTSKEIVRRLEAAKMTTEGAPDSARAEGKLRGKGYFTWDLAAGRATELQATLEWHLVMIARWKAGSNEVGVDVAVAGTTELKHKYSER